MTRSVNWQDLLGELAPLRRRWDVPVLLSLAEGRMRPADLIKAINSHDSIGRTGREITWKVLTDTQRGHTERRIRPGCVSAQVADWNAFRVRSHAIHVPFTFHGGLADQQR